MSMTYQTLLSAEHRPMCITASHENQNLAEFVQSEAHVLQAMLIKHGAILFRNFDVTNVSAFASFARATGGHSIDYLVKSTPRTAIGDQIYTSTEYPAYREILLHNENAYDRVWPLRIAFCCLTPATHGGETPLADMRDVTERLGANLVDRFEAAKVRYIRHYHRGIDLDWRDVFRTADPVELAQTCAAAEIEHEWLDSPGTLLRTVRVAQGVAVHPATADRLFFNQAHLFHITSMGEDVAQMLTASFGRDRVPRHATYGDCSEISPGDIRRVQDAFRKSEFTFKWERGDVLWVDNLQFAHGRRPYRGDRKVFVALMDSSDQDSSA
jgi:alpha-ketoglutarate-dependent taurine dioxygenase